MFGNSDTSLGRVYILKLEQEKYYVGYTTKGMDRIKQHIEEKGAMWTKKYPPVDLLDFSNTGKTMEDEDRKTIEMMQKYGMENVRGGKWCDIVFDDLTTRHLKGLIANFSPEKYTKKLRRPIRSKAQKRAAKLGIKSPKEKARESMIARGVFEYNDLEGRREKSSKLIRFIHRIRRHNKAGKPWAMKWYPILSEFGLKDSGVGLNPLRPLYPKDHWKHEPELYNESLSREFEEDGFRWGSSGGAFSPRFACSKCYKKGHISDDCMGLGEPRDPQDSEVMESLRGFKIQ